MAKSQAAVVVQRPSAEGETQSAEEASARNLVANQRLLHSMRRALKDLASDKTIPVDDLPKAIARKMEAGQITARRIDKKQFA